MATKKKPTAKKKAKAKTSAQKTSAQKTSAQKTSAKKTSAKKTSAKKTSAQKTSAKKTSAQKTSAKKKAKAGPPLTTAEAAALTDILDQWDDGESYDHAGDFLTDAAEFHDRDLGALQARWDKAVHEAGMMMLDAYAPE